ncbi:unnamed protein product [Calypogeia fissa]
MSEEKTEFALKNITEGCTVIMDTVVNGWVGMALIIPPHMQLLDSGKRGDDTFCWAKVQGWDGPIYQGSIYASCEWPLRIELWEWMIASLPQDKWIFAGDFNILELLDDTTDYSSVIHGSECRVWKWTLVSFGSHSDEDLEKLGELENALKQATYREVAVWRARSTRVCWPGLGDAPTKYFFQLVKAKWKREEILVLELEDGSRIEDEDALYIVDTTVATNVAQRDQMLTSLITAKISSDDNDRLCALPYEEEVNEIVWDLPNGKALSLHGIATKMLRLC